MLILIDQQEKLPYDFASVHSPVLPFTTETCHLVTGDYCSPDPQPALHDTSSCSPGCAVVERKTLSDLYSTLGQHRARFERELHRLSYCGYAALVIEADWATIAQPNAVLDHPTKLSPKSVIATLLAWSQRYHVHLFPCPNRNFAEQLTFRLLERWVRDKGRRPLDPKKEGTPT
jgi:DNA excision repair protein ERCC-4